MESCRAANWKKLVFNESQERETIILDNKFIPLTQPSGSVLKSTAELKQAVEMIPDIADPHRGYFTLKVNQNDWRKLYEI